MTPPEINQLLDSLAKVLWRCFVLGCLFLFFWIVAYLTAGQKIFAVPGEMFGLTKRDLDVIHYCGIGFAKVCVVIFFLFPYLAIRMGRGASGDGPG